MAQGAFLDNFNTYKNAILKNKSSYSDEGNGHGSGLLS